MRIFVIAWIFLVACSHSPDNSGQSLHQFNNTKINVGALSRKEARSIIDEDAVRLKRNFGSLLVQLADKRKRRDQVFDEVIKAYPECQAQRHCISNLVISNKSDFEKYTALMQKLHQVDMEVAAAENIVKEREDQHKLLVRFTMNRNLVRELVTLATTDAQSKIEIYVHSLESFPSWDRIGRRILEVSGQKLALYQAKDIAFSRFGEIINESALLLTLDIRIYMVDKPRRRFLQSFILDSRPSGDNFADFRTMENIRNHLLESDELNKDSICGFYSIASRTLLHQFSGSIISMCEKERLFQEQTATARAVGLLRMDQFVIPVGFHSLE